LVQVEATSDCGPRVAQKITGGLFFPTPNVVDITYEHRQLGKGANAIDVSTRVQGKQYVIAATGCEDVYLVARGSMFPWHVRTTAKGSNHVLYFTNVVLDRAYEIEDGLGYQYDVKTAGRSTRVQTITGRVVQDMWPESLLLGKKEQGLLYEQRA